MVFQSVVDAWLLELQDVAGLEDATQHRYSSWSSAAIADSTPGRHIAVWPEADPEVRRGFTTDASDEVLTSYIIQVWEGATAEATRVFEDDDANAEWLALYEAVEDRLYLKSNLAIGDAGSITNYMGGKFDQVGDKRVFALRFIKTHTKSFV